MNYKLIVAQPQISLQINYCSYFPLLVMCWELGKIPASLVIITTNHVGIRKENTGYYVIALIRKEKSWNNMIALIRQERTWYYVTAKRKKHDLMLLLWSESKKI